MLLLHATKVEYFPSNRWFLRRMTGKKVFIYSMIETFQSIRNFSTGFFASRNAILIVAIVI